MDLRQKTILTITAIMMLSLLLVILFADNGFLEMNRASTQRDRIVFENERLAKENLDLYRTIDRLKHDNDYLESVARREFGLVEKNELIFKTANTKGKKP
jgi:cell division protein FtsB